MRFLNQGISKVCDSAGKLTVMFKRDLINKIVGIVQDKVNASVFHFWLINIELEEHVICRCRFSLDDRRKEPVLRHGTL